jgi:quaternary ammonium compound-resistance protein SugE
MAWMYLLLAGIFEVVWTVSMKYSEGFTRLWPTVSTMVAGFTSFMFLGQAIKTLPIGTAYAVWTGMGSVGTVIVGIWLFGESRTLFRMVCALLIVVGTVGLKFTSKSKPHIAIEGSSMMRNP